MLVRVWTTNFDTGRKARLVAYANEVSLPVLSSRTGCQGVLFFSDGNQWTTLTLWESEADIAALDQDADYRKIVEGILDLGVLRGEQQTRVFRHEGGLLFEGVMIEGRKRD
jgi:quinol monooxygenase YgiN